MGEPAEQNLDAPHRMHADTQPAVLDDCSSETWVSLAVSGAGVRLGVRLLDASTNSEVSLGLAHSRSSKKERVGAYYNYIYILDIEKKRHSNKMWGTYLRAIS